MDLRDLLEGRITATTKITIQSKTTTVAYADSVVLFFINLLHELTEMPDCDTHTTEKNEWIRRNGSPVISGSTFRHIVQKGVVVVEGFQLRGYMLPGFTVRDHHGRIIAQCDRAGKVSCYDKGSGWGFRLGLFSYKTWATYHINEYGVPHGPYSEQITRGRKTILQYGNYDCGVFTGARQVTVAPNPMTSITWTLTSVTTFEDGVEGSTRQTVRDCAQDKSHAPALPLQMLEGGVIVWKVCMVKDNLNYPGPRYAFVKLFVPLDAKRTKYIKETDKFRVSHALVVNIVGVLDSSRWYKRAVSFVYNGASLHYVRNQMVYANGFNDDPNVECGEGLSVHLCKEHTLQWLPVAVVYQMEQREQVSRYAAKCAASR